MSDKQFEFLNSLQLTEKLNKTPIVCLILGSLENREVKNESISGFRTT